MKFLITNWIPVSLGIIIILVVLGSLRGRNGSGAMVKNFQTAYRENEEWIPPFFKISTAWRIKRSGGSSG